MPSVLETPEVVTTVDTSDLISEPRARLASGRTRLGLWRVLAQSIVTFLTPARREHHAPSFEPSLDRFVQEYPSLSLYAFTRI